MPNMLSWQGLCSGPHSLQHSSDPLARFGKVREGKDWERRRGMGKNRKEK